MHVGAAQGRRSGDSSSPRAPGSGLLGGIESQGFHSASLGGSVGSQPQPAGPRRLSFSPGESGLGSGSLPRGLGLLH